MQFVFFVCVEPPFKVDDPEALHRDTSAWVEEMEGRGVLKGGDRLRPAADAATVRIRNNERIVRDGPFAETKEKIAGYDIIECADRNEAVEIASKHPMAKLGTIEVRPVWPL